MKGSTEARIFTPPARKLTPDTSLGFAAIEYAKRILGKTLIPWQEWALIHSLEIVGDLNGSWKFRFRTVLFLVSRQNGKTVLSEIIASFFQNVLQVPSIFGTSLSLDKAEEVWEAVIQDQEASPDLASDIDRVSRTNGGKRLILKGNRSYKVGAPTRRAGRGDSNDLVMLDEVRELRDYEVWSAAVASTNAKPNGIVMCFSNAGDPDSVVLRQLRATAIERIEGKKADDYGGEVDGDTLGLFEWSAPDDAETDDMEALAMANPSLGYGYLTERALLSNRSTFPENKFRSECMCQQVETILPEPFPDGAWKAGIDPSSFISADSELWFGIDLSNDRRWLSIGVAGQREDGQWHVEAVKRSVGYEWAGEWFAERVGKYGIIHLAFQGRGAPVSGIAEKLCMIPGVERCAIEGPELSAGWGRFYDGIANSTPPEPGQPARGGTRIFHLPQPVIDLPARTMQLKTMGGGATLPDKAKSPDDPSPLFACVMAYAAATRIRPAEEKKVYESAYAQGAPLVFC